MHPLEITNARKVFNQHTAIDKVSCVFPEKTITAIIGKSGCGKSTLLKLLNGLESPDEGEVLFLGQSLQTQNINDARKKMGYAVQGTGLFPHLTLKQNITLVAELEQWSTHDIEQRLNFLSEIVQLESDLLTRYPHTVSGGQQQRAGLCRAMMLKPDILLLDEAFAAVDPITRVEIHHHLLALQSLEPRCIVMVTHDMREAELLADRFLIMKAGTVTQQVTRSDIKKQYPESSIEQWLLESL
ncbi:ATP-binding cassette domain-containing protein [Pleionea sp. CnH1-48]|uniref:ATP-binding cassette domain-containing protein n=1 Tax=Pleionea sp. CnH1-48 TaxID=2954494 RepID=UPI00209841EE|nr:ATP-binding cassette domain-containing protein [Pleionea sp. CnH1-48]MCO7225104.1 ATP-binding cassette domain-containing protein [Pleionea sp. CnH1-48]